MAGEARFSRQGLHGYRPGFGLITLRPWNPNEEINVFRTKTGFVIKIQLFISTTLLLELQCDESEAHAIQSRLQEFSHIRVWFNQ